ncbi:Uncharacterised protein [Serratia rubidaea]|uniref:hypothetical protein n=1 Tax=Serratia rubidaea TaxID=61652 RepID=UPI000B0A822B|nr:hypothetical protein [Serratia rubidaea]QPR64237.1 hypothetical protein I6G83_02975 [Serratia rubidaea]CAI1064002.1 Uncharacterised protein [Serratia rubidaea]CAI1876386.1 Uncharacterised protein [Serratia rubidaea]HAY0638311.1 hypothetical protein [Serratia rubidaea]
MDGGGIFLGTIFSAEKKAILFFLVFLHFLLLSGLWMAISLCISLRGDITGIVRLEKKGRAYDPVALNFKLVNSSERPVILNHIEWGDGKSVLGRIIPDCLPIRIDSRESRCLHIPLSGKGGLVSWLAGEIDFFGLDIDGLTYWVVLSTGNKYPVRTGSNISAALSRVMSRIVFLWNG